MIKKKKIKIMLGDVFEFQLPNGKYAYGRAYMGASFGFYNKLSDVPNNPPIGHREYFFIVWFQSGVIKDGLYKIVGNDPFYSIVEATPPPTGGENPIYGYAIYENKQIRQATKEECEGLEPMEIFEIKDVIERIMKTLETKQE